MRIEPRAFFNNQNKEMNRMKKLICTLLALTLMLLPALCLADDDDSLITVQGRASVLVMPDIATLYFGASFTEDDAQVAQTSVNTAASAAREAITALGIAPEAITTNSISIYREYDYSGDSARAIGFTASTQLCVTLEDISLAGQVIDAALGAGLNNVRNVEFSSSKQAEYYDQALAMATQNAAHKADILATAAGYTLGRIHSLTEEYSSGMYYLRGEAGYDMVAAAGVNGSTSISSGEIEIEATVTAVYNLK